MKYELSHDTIAKQVYQKASTEARTRRKVERFVSERYEAYQQRAARLTQDDVDYVTPYLSQINISAEEAAFVDQGRQALLRAQRRRRAIVLGIMAILTAISLLAIWQGQLAKAANVEVLKQKDEAVAARQDASAKADSLSLQEVALQASLRIAELAKDTAEQRRFEAKLAQIQADRNADLANQKRLEAEALTLITKATSLPREKMWTALRIAETAWERTPKPLPEVSRGLANIFYAQLGNKEQFHQPLPIACIDDDFDILSTMTSLDGSKIMTFDRDDNSRKIWSIEGQLIAHLDKHKDNTRTAKFSPDGSKFLTSSEQGNAMFLYSIDGNLLARFDKQRGGIRIDNFSPASSRIITTGIADNVAYLYNEDGQLLEELNAHTNHIETVNFSPNGELILTTAKQDSVARFWAANDGKIQSEQIVERGGFDHVFFSPRGKYICSIAGTKIKIWDMAGQVIDSLNKAIEADYRLTYDDIKFSPDEQYVVLKPAKENPILWQFANSHSTHSLDTGEGIYDYVDFSEDGSHFITVNKYFGGYSVGKLWSKEGGLIKSYRLNSARNLAPLVFSPTEKRIVSFPVGDKEKIAVLHDLEGKEIESLKHEARITYAQFSLNGGKILTADSDGLIKIWSTEDGRLIANLFGQFSNIRSAGFSSHGDYVYSISEKQRISIWPISGVLVNTLENFQMTAPGDEVFFPAKGGAYSTTTGTVLFPYWRVPNSMSEVLVPIVVSPEEDLVFGYSKEHEAQEVWSIDGHYKNPLEFDDGFYSAVFSPDNQWLFAKSREGNAKLLSSRGEFKHNYSNDNHDSRKLLFSHETNQVLTYNGFKSENAQLYSITEPRTVKELIHGSIVIGAFFASDDSFLITAGEDGTIKMWSSTGDPIRSLLDNYYDISVLAPAPDGNQFLIATKNGSLQLCSMQGHCRKLLNNQSSYTIFSVEFSDDGEHIFMGCNDNSVRMIDLQGREMAVVSDASRKDDFSLVGVALSADGRNVLAVSELPLSGNGEVACQAWPTPQRIYDYLKNEAAIPELTPEQRKLYGID